MKKTSFWVLVLESLVVFHRTIQLSLFSIIGWGIDLDYCDIEWFALDMSRDHSVIFEIVPKYLISDSFVDYDGCSISSKRFLPTVLDIMVIWINLPILAHFSSLIPKMSMFTLAIPCLTASNLPWFMELMFQVPMQYCSLQHLTLLPPPVTSTTGHCFHFGSVSSFFLELFLHFTLVAYGTPTDLGSSSFSVLSFCLFILFIGFSRKEY